MAEMKSTELETKDAEVMVEEESAEGISEETFKSVLNETLDEQEPGDIQEAMEPVEELEEELDDEADDESEEPDDDPEREDQTAGSDNAGNEGLIGNLDIFSRRKQSVQLQGRKKSRTYSNKAIIPLDDDGVIKAETPADIRKKEFNELNASMRANKILKGIVSSSSYSQNTDVWFLSIFYGDWFKVLIPLHRVVPGKSLEDIRAMSQQEQRLYGNLYLGAEIEYEVTKVDEGNTLAIGDRILAMEARRRRLFLPTSSLAKPESGMVMEARVVSVAQHYINVEFHGIESSIRVNDIAYYRIPDLRQHYKNGQRVIIKIKSINADITKRNVPVEASVSIKEAQADPRVENIKKLTENQSCEGEVTLINQNGVYILLKDLKMEVLAKLPKFSDPIHAGSHVVVRITTIDEEELRVFGSISWVC